MGRHQPARLGHVGVEAARDTGHHRDEALVGRGGVERLLGKLAQQRDRVVAQPLPALGIEPCEEVARLGAPRRPDVSGDLPSQAMRSGSAGWTSTSWTFMRGSPPVGAAVTGARSHRRRRPRATPEARIIGPALASGLVGLADLGERLARLGRGAPGSRPGSRGRPPCGTPARAEAPGSPAAPSRREPRALSTSSTSSPIMMLWFALRVSTSMCQAS